MHLHWILSVSAVCVSSAFAQPSTDMIVGDSFSLGRGFAAGMAVNLPAPPPAGERRVLRSPGLRAVVWRSADGALPLFLEASGQGALRKISKGLAETPQSGVIPNLGTPILQTSASFRYRGLSEACDEFLDLGYRDGVLVSAKWTFCAE